MFRFIRNFVLIIVLFVLLFSYAMFQGGFTSWFLFYSFLPICIYHLCFLFYPLRNFEVTRKLSQHVISSGSTIKVTIQLKRKYPFPLFYCVSEDVLPPSLMKIDNRHIKYEDLRKTERPRASNFIKNGAFPLFKRNITMEYELSHIPRGEHDFTMIKLRTGDVFGFIKKEQTFTVDSQLIAFPKMRAIKMFEQVSSFEQGSISSHHVHLKNTNVATGIREYMPGDKFSWIDWKQTAKQNDVMTKEFEQEKSDDTLIVLDACHEGYVPEVVFDAAVEVCYSFIEQLNKQVAQVGLLSISEEIVHFPVQHGAIKMEGIRKHVTKVQQTGEHFSQKLLEELRFVTKPFTTFIITSQLDDELINVLGKLKTQQKKICVMYIQSMHHMTDEVYILIQKLRERNIAISVLTEKEMMKNPIEVKML